MFIPKRKSTKVCVSLVWCSWANLGTIPIQKHMSLFFHPRKFHQKLVGDFYPSVKNISQTDWLPQVGVKIKNVWNHHLENLIENINIFLNTHPKTISTWNCQTNFENIFIKYLDPGSQPPLLKKQCFLVDDNPVLLKKMVVELPGYTPWKINGWFTYKSPI